MKTIMLVLLLHTVDIYYKLLMKGFVEMIANLRTSLHLSVSEIFCNFWKAFHV